MSIRIKIFSIIIFGQIGFFLGILPLFFRISSNLSVASREERIRDLVYSFHREISQKEKSLEFFATEIEENPKLKESLNNGIKNREFFLKNISYFQEIMKKRELSIFEIGDKEGKVFFRFHRPKDYGDDKSRQPIIQNAIHGKISSALEIGHSGLGLRTAIPFSDHTILLGRVVDDKFAENISVSKNVHFAIFSDEKLLAVNGKFMKNYLKEHPSPTAKDVLYNEKNFYAFLQPYSDETLRSNKVNFFILVDETKFNQEFSEARRNFILISGFVMIVVFLLTIAFSEKLLKAIGKLQNSMIHFQEENAPIPDVKRKDELGDMARAFIAMKNQLIEFHTQELGRKNDEKEKIKQTFGKIVDPKVRDYLLNKNNLLGGELVHATILFADIRGFTSLSEKMSPEKTVTFLNRYFDSVARCIYEETGIINKYIGDAIMAVFGILGESKNHARSAVLAAMKMRKAVEHLNSEFIRDGLPEVNIGIGIHTGFVLAGNIGSAQRMEFTVIGDSVNIASRMESLCKYFRRDIIMTGSTKDLSGFSEPVKFLHTVKLKGRSEKVAAYSI